MMNKKIAAAEACLQELRTNKRLRTIIDMREKARLDRNSGMDYALNEGLAKGLAEGEAKGLEKGEVKSRIETAIRMKADGMSPAQISRYTTLSVEEIAKL